MGRAVPALCPAGSVWSPDMKISSSDALAVPCQVPSCVVGQSADYKGGPTVGLFLANQIKLSPQGKQHQPDIL